MLFSTGLVYACVGYVGYVSLMPPRWRPVYPPAVEGFDSYAQALDDRLFWTSIWHTALFFLVSYALIVILGIVLAALMHSRIYLPTIFKVIIFVPSVIAPAIMAPVHRQVFAADGPINWFLERLGLIAVEANGTRVWAGWLQGLLPKIGLGDVTPNWIQPTTSLWVVVAAQVFSSVGIAFILFFASMGQIDRETLEAAKIDGAGNIRVLWSIIVPATRPTIATLAILHGITSLKLFDYPYLITSGGPAHSSEFLGTLIYNVLFGTSSRYGYASALSVMLFVLALGTSVLMSLSTRERRPRAPKAAGRV
ncbi:MAG: sugar ABC transporter permease [Bifidobacteriaceae bacterium]|nr:sugar ABC transporter permease [Bifidobacteriaceae bacterium]